MFDPYHGALRMVFVLLDSAEQRMEWDRLRLLDFFVVFPHLLGALSLPADLKARRRAFDEIPEPYEALPSPPRLFFQLGEIQAPAARLLIAGGFWSKDALNDGYAQFDSPDVPVRLQSLASKLSYREQPWYRLIVEGLVTVPLNGRRGLKERAGVMEFRHDPV